MKGVRGRSGNPNVYRFKEALTAIPHTEYLERLIIIVQHIQEIRPATFKKGIYLGGKQHGTKVDLGSEVMNVGFFVREPEEDTSEWQRIDRATNDLHYAGYLAISVFPPSLLFRHWLLVDHIKFQVFRHVKGKTLDNIVRKQD